MIPLLPYNSRSRVFHIRPHYAPNAPCLPIGRLTGAERSAERFIGLREVKRRLAGTGVIVVLNNVIVLFLPR